MEWKTIAGNAKKDRINYCKLVEDKRLFNAYYSTYTVTLNELKAIVKSSTKKGEGNLESTISVERYER